MMLPSLDQLHECMENYYLNDVVSLSHIFPKLVETYTVLATSVAISYPSCKNSEALIS